MAPQTSPSPSGKCLSVHAMLTFIVGLLALNAIGFLFLSIQFSTRQSAVVIAPSSLDSKLDAISAKLAAFQSQTRPSAIMPEADEDASAIPYREWDLIVAYPKGYSIVQNDDAFVQGQKNLLITSRPGRLFRSSGGPATPGPEDFLSGYQMTISELDARQDPIGDARLVGTVNPLVDKIDFICDGAGCPLEKYLITTSHGVRYLIETNASSDFVDAAVVTASIIASISE